MEEFTKPKRVDVGWFVEEPQAKFIFEEPVRLFSERKKALSSRAVQACPAVNELERDLFVIKCPFDIRLQCRKNGEAFELHVVEQGTRIDIDIIGNFLMLMKPDLWRDSRFPVIQLKIPYFFLSDVPCYMTQTAPHMSTVYNRLPGLLISGRFPIHVWPRIMNWAFEWTDLKNDVILRRGDHLCYLYFETAALRTEPNLFELELTDELIEFRKGLSATPKYMSNTFSLFETALKRRPEKLLHRKKK